MAKDKFFFSRIDTYSPGLSDTRNIMCSGSGKGVCGSQWFTVPGHMRLVLEVMTFLQSDRWGLWGWFSHLEEEGLMREKKKQANVSRGSNTHLFCHSEESSPSEVSVRFTSCSPKLAASGSNFSWRIWFKLQIKKWCCNFLVIVLLGSAPWSRCFCLSIFDITGLWTMTLTRSRILQSCSEWEKSPVGRSRTLFRSSGDWPPIATLSCLSLSSLCSPLVQGLYADLQLAELVWTKMSSHISGTIRRCGDWRK